MNRVNRQITLVVACALTAACAAQHSSMTPQSSAASAVPSSVVRGGCITPHANGPDELGCYFITEDAFGQATKSTVYWHLYTYPTRAAAEAAKTQRATVVESFGKVWLMTLADSNWRSTSGDFVGRVGPIPLTPGTSYTSRYMDATFEQGMRTRSHRHSGPEAWFVLKGAQCLETPDGITVVHAGQGSVVREGPPMVLSGGRDIRQALVLVVYDSSKPWTIVEHDWDTKGVCPA